MDKEMLLQNLLRVITPAEIEELSATYVGDNRLSLTEILENQIFNSEKAKILPFGLSNEDNQSKKTLQEESNSDEKSEADSINEENKDVDKKDEDNKSDEVIDKKKEKEISEDDKVDTLAFILEEKERFRESRNKLGQKDIFTTYKKNASAGAKGTKKGEKNSMSYGNNGILVNKKFG